MESKAFVRCRTPETKFDYEGVGPSVRPLSAAPRLTLPRDRRRPHQLHLPRSTLFMLVSALMGRERMQAGYAHAIGAEYRFYFYGDASLLLAAS